jgi:hypothetical protein
VLLKRDKDMPQIAQIYADYQQQQITWLDADYLRAETILCAGRQKIKSV